MTATLTAVYERHDNWFIGYVEELPKRKRSRSDAGRSPRELARTRAVDY